MARPEDYRWSSIHTHLGQACDPLLTLHPLYLSLGRDSMQRAEACGIWLRSGIDEGELADVSAVMIALGYPYIDGYKPRGNYQAMLVDAVEAQLLANDELQASVQAAVLRPATAAQEARNRSLGRAGELFIAELESRRLHAAGKKVLANRVEHVAATQGDGLGFDVLSFENSGRERLIEVKTTTFGQLTPFYVSRNELARSKADAEIYRLYRVFDFRDRPRLFDLPGAISASCNLEAASYLARVAG